jgi:hypothetical protein
MTSKNVNINQPEMCTLSSLTQAPNAASRVMISLPTSQAGTPLVPGVLVAVAFAPMEYETDLSRPRVAGAGKGRVLWMAPDF